MSTAYKFNNYSSVTHVCTIINANFVMPNSASTLTKDQKMWCYDRHVVARSLCFYGKWMSLRFWITHSGTVDVEYEYSVVS